MVTSDAVIEAVQRRLEDFATSVGAGAEETVYTDVVQAARSRFPWLLINLTLGLTVALVIEQQTGIISEVPVLAALMPIAAMLGGNGGTQSLAVVIRSLSSDDVPGSRIAGVLGRQLRIGLLVGLAVSAATALLTLVLLNLGVLESNTVEHLRVSGVGVWPPANPSIATTSGQYPADPAPSDSTLRWRRRSLTFAPTIAFGGFAGGDPAPVSQELITNPDSPTGGLELDLTTVDQAGQMVLDELVLSSVRSPALSAASRRRRRRSPHLRQPSPRVGPEKFSMLTSEYRRAS